MGFEKISSYAIGSRSGQGGQRVHGTYAATNTTGPVNIDGNMGIKTIEHKRVEQTLKNSEEIFRNISTASQDAIVLVDNDERILYWNEAAERLFSYSKEEAVGKNLHRLIIPDRLRGNYIKAFRRFRDKGQGLAIGETLELTAIRRDGTRLLIEISLSAVKINDKWHAIGIIKDSIEHKLAEEAIKHKHMAYHDELTALPKRNLFIDRLTLALAHAHRHRQMVGVLFLDLDRF
ncbi:MAG: PAS domain S-box protein, partial [Candidatus Bathyanammoxibius sp.]